MLSLRLVRICIAFIYKMSQAKSLPVSPQMPLTAWLCLGLQLEIWCHCFLIRVSGRAWERGSAWRACRKGGASGHSSHLKKVG